MPETFEEVCANIKACLNSSKNQISMSDLDRDYNSILGTKIPFHALGFRSLESLLRTVPDLKITQIGREVFIDVKLDEKTIHITNLVRGQKCSKKKPPNSYRRYGYRRPPPPRRLTPPKSQFKPTNSRYGSQSTAPKQYEQPRYPLKSYDDQKYNAPSVKYNADPKPLSKVFTDPKASAPRDSKSSASYKHPGDPRSNAPRYISESQNKAPQYYQVPQYNSGANSTIYNHSKDYNHNSHSNHNYENSRPRKKSVSPQFSPTFSDSEEDSFIDLTVNGHTKPNLQVTSGNSRKVTVGKQNSRIPNNLMKHNSIDEDFESSSMNSYSEYSHQASSDEDYIPRNSTPRFHRNHNPRHGKSTPARYVEQDVPKFENIKITIKNNGPRDYIKLFYENERRLTLNSVDLK